MILVQLQSFVQRWERYFLLFFFVSPSHLVSNFCFRGKRVDVSISFRMKSSHRVLFVAAAFLYKRRRFLLLPRPTGKPLTATNPLHLLIEYPNYLPLRYWQFIDLTGKSKNPRNYCRTFIQAYFFFCFKSALWESHFDHSMNFHLL